MFLSAPPFIALTCIRARSARAVRVGLRPPQPLFVARLLRVFVISRLGFPTETATLRDSRTRPPQNPFSVGTLHYDVRQRNKQMYKQRKRSHKKQLLLTSSGLRPEPPTLRGFPPNPRLVFKLGVASAPQAVSTSPPPLRGAFPYGATPPSPRLFVRKRNVILPWVIVFFVAVPAFPPSFNQVVKQPTFVRYTAEYLGHVIVTTESHHLLCAHSTLNVQFPFPLLFFFLFHTKL